MRTSTLDFIMDGGLINTLMQIQARKMIFQTLRKILVPEL